MPDIGRLVGAEFRGPSAVSVVDRSVDVKLAAYPNAGMVPAKPFLISHHSLGVGRSSTFYSRVINIHISYYVVQVPKFIKSHCPNPGVEVSCAHFYQREQNDSSCPEKQLTCR